MQFRTFAAFLSAMLLGACASPQHYRDRDPGFIALQVINTTPARFASVSAYNDDYDCYSGQGLLPSPLANFSEISATLHRRPYQTIAFHYGALGGASSFVSCGGVWTFRADESKNYRLRAMQRPEDKSCRIEVTRQVEATGEWVPVDMTKRDLTQPLVDPVGPWCKADARFAGSSRMETPRGP